MKSQSFLTIAVVLSVCGFAVPLLLSKRAFTSGVPDIYISTPELRFTGVPRNKPVTKTIEIENVGDADLIIESIHTGCGCSKSWLTPSNVVSPGKSSTLHVSLELSGTTENLRTISEVFLQSNDPNEPLTRISVLVSPQDVTSPQPSLIDFGQLAPDQLPATRQLFDADESSAAKSVEVFYSTGGIDLIETPPGQSPALLARVQRSVRPGDFYSVFMVGNPSTNIAAEVIVRGHVIGKLMAIPQTIVLSQNDSKTASTSKLFRVFSRSDGASSDSFDCSACNILVNGTVAEYLSVRRDENNSFIVEAELTKMDREKSTRREIGEIVLQCGNDGGSATVGVPVIVEVRERRYVP